MDAEELRKQLDDLAELRAQGVITSDERLAQRAALVAAYNASQDVRPTDSELAPAAEEAVAFEAGVPSRRSGPRWFIVAPVLLGIFAATLYIANEFAGGDQAKPTDSAGRAVGPASVFEPGTCEFAMPAGQTEGETVVCGTVEVPQNHADFSGTKIRLAVAVMRATSQDANRDPFVYLQGGPGGATLGTVTELFSADFAAPIQLSRDLVFIDQRGTGFSQPNLNCTDEEDLLAASTIPVGESEIQAAIESCSARYRADGVIVAHYNTAQSAQDIYHVLTALGYRTWNLYGVSYGTRLALQLVADHPEAARSVILDSAVPFDEFFNNAAVRSFDRSMQAVFDACADQQACNAAYPDLHASLNRLILSLDEEPLTIAGTDESTGDLNEITINGQLLLGALQQLLYFSDLVKMVPALIEQLEHRQLQAPEATLFASLMLGTPEGGFADGVYRTMECLESLPLVPQNAPVSGVYLPSSDLFSRGDIRVAAARCSKWGVPVPLQLKPPRLDIPVPVVILTGQFDPITPPAWGEQLAASLANATAYFFPGSAHGVLEDECSMKLVSTFIEDPANPDSSCIATLAPDAFVIS